MNQQTKKIFSIILAVVVGLGIVLFAWKGGALFGGKVSVDTQADDSWKDSLSVVPQASSTQTLGASNFNKEITPEENSIATTSTSILARDMLVNYALTQKNNPSGVMSDAEVDATAQSLISNIEMPKAKQYTLKDLNISRDNSDAAYAAYGKKVMSIVTTSSAKSETSELTVFLGAVSANDPKKLEELATYTAEYRAVKNSLLAVKTPSEVAPLHLRFVQNYANIESALGSMQKMFSDPVQGLAGFTQYKKEIAALGVIGSDYQNFKPARP